MNTINKEQINKTIDELEKIDSKLRGMNASFELMAVGAPHYANGDMIEDLLLHFHDEIENVRIQLDEVTGSVFRMKETAKQ